MERSAERNETNIFFMRTHATTNFFQSSHLNLKYLCESRVLNERKKHYGQCVNATFPTIH